MKILGIIPARFASTRFPGKPLIDISGKTMIQRVFEQCKKSKSLDEIIVATDDQRIFDHVESFGGKAFMTKVDHPSGTDRCQEVAAHFKGKFDAVINIQGDEPFIFPEQIDELASCFNDTNTEIATLVKPVTQAEQLSNAGFVMTAIDINGFALYFSRFPIPFQKGRPQEEWLKHHLYFDHVGIYGYKTEILEKICALPPSSLELAESLEQLRWLENGFKIKTQITHYESYPVDTPEDLAKLPKNLID